MEREIKFIVWDGVKIYQLEATKEKANHILQCGSDGFWLFSYENGKLITSTEMGGKLLQYTGKKDKNGKEIYEGHIYKWEYEYDSDYDGDMPITRTSKGIGHVKDIFDTTRIKMANSEGEGVEIIGNIYENPELLKS